MKQKMANDENNKSSKFPRVEKPSSATISISQMFLEATNQLKEEEITVEEVRNYTINHYNVDILNYLDDINLSTRFSEFKMPRIVAPKGRIKKIEPCRKIIHKTARTMKLPLKKPNGLIEQKRRICKRKATEKVTKVVTRFQNKTDSIDTFFNDATLKQPEKSRSEISLLAKVENDKTHQKTFCRRIDSPRPQNSSHGIVVNRSFGASPSIPPQSCPYIPIKCTTCEENKNKIKNCTSSTHGNAKETLTTENDLNHLQKSNSMTKLGYAVTNFIKDLGCKYIPQLNFKNQSHDLRFQEKVNKGVQVSYDCVTHDLIDISSIENNLQEEENIDEKSPKNGFMNKNMNKNMKFEAILENKFRPNERKHSLQENTWNQNLRDDNFILIETNADFKKVVSDTCNSNLSTVIKESKIRDSKKFEENMEIDKYHLEMNKEKNCQAKESEKEHLATHLKDELYKRKKLHSVRNERKSTKEAAKRNKRGFQSAPAILNSSNIAQNLEGGTKRIGGKVIGANVKKRKRECGKLTGESDSDAKNNSNDVRIKRMIKLVNKRKLKQNQEKTIEKVTSKDSSKKGNCKTVPMNKRGR